MKASKEVQWCLKKLKEAIADYNIKDAENYAEMLEIWLGR
ncbi:hypothetical protein HOR87_gp52 [Marinomonas phage CB5A]|uniref:Uncharacterized protein n=3 Tax=Murciavirus TaxID=2731675 RepID=A0A1W5S364_9CAUD|nr:hypothetical protein HOR72_gp23 [Marinomonas phage CPP1m]YP_009791141.1 hypothetical protein HOR87_gp52 [Marinomonas phage CB5A]ARB11267.1 hypothetical protein [Marinomonas phage CPP1m]ARB11317.1 hypothetical protein [Marinomonas phage CPG1g]ASP46262.1 hypothetical protein [Marinomonas phage CB5A]